jgi:hypothetical protein
MDLAVIHSESTLTKLRMLTEFRDNDKVFEPSGVLLGEYVLFGDGLMLLDKNGDLIKINHTHHDIAFRGSIDDRYMRDQNGVVDGLLKDWNNLQVVENVPVISHPFAYNYYHFSLELAAKIRFFEKLDIEQALIPLSNVVQNYQRDILIRCAKRFRISTYSQPIRVKNPLLAAGFRTMEGTLWLRSTLGMKCKPGNKRYYIRRSSRGLSENDTLKAFIEKFDFETVDFEVGDLSVEEQVKRLDNAGIILAAHGANLVNTIYLNKPLTIIEILGSRYACSAFMDTSSVLEFNYHAVVSSNYDDNDNIVVDCDKLGALVDSIISNL